MTLIKSISGIRGTIGGKGGITTPVDAVKFASAYGTWLKITPLNLNLPLW
jgi:phosphomannomutase